MNHQTRSQTSRGAAAALALAASLLAGAAVHAQTATVTVRDAWVREPAGGRTDTAAFATIENTGTADRAIVGARAEGAATVELHEMKMSGAMMRMAPVARIELPAGQTVSLKPGGLHVMLFGLRRTAKSGDTVALTLRFDDGSELAVVAPVRKQEGMR